MGSKVNVRFKAKSIDTGEEVSGWYWENKGIGYIIEDDETIQPPIYRTHRVLPSQVVMFEKEEEE